MLSCKAFWVGHRGFEESWVIYAPAKGIAFFFCMESFDNTIFAYSVNISSRTNA